VTILENHKAREQQKRADYSTSKITAANASGKLASQATL